MIIGIVMMLLYVPVMCSGESDAYLLFVFGLGIFVVGGIGAYWYHG